MTEARILIVEDEPVIAMTLSGSLESLGYKVVGSVASGEEGIHIVEEFSPDLVLMDIKLEGKMDGIEAAEQIRSRFDVPVVYLTGYGDKDVLNRAKKTDPYGYLSKPAGLPELKSSIETALFKHDADKKLRESEAKYRGFVELSPYGVAVHSEGEIVFVNKAGAALLGSTIEEIIGKPVMDFVHPDYREIVTKPNQRMSERGDAAPLIDQKLVKEDGTILDIEAAAVPITYGGKPAWQVVFRDISDRKKAEESKRQARDTLERQVEERTAELRENEEKFRGIFETVASSIIVVDSNGRIVEMNTYHTTNIGKGLTKKEDYLGKVIWELPNIVASGSMEGYRSVLAGETLDLPGVYFPSTGGDTYAYLNVRGKPLIRDSQVIGAVFTHEDITERRKVEEELRKAHDELERRVKERTIELSNANEQLRNEIAQRKKAELDLVGSENRYRSLIETAKDVIWSVDREYRCTYISPSITDVLGYTVEEMMSMNPLTGFVSSSLDRFLQAFGQEPGSTGDRPTGARTPAPEVIEYYHKDGSTRWMEISATLLYDEAGNPSGLQGIARDVTEMKRAEERIKTSLREKEVLLREIHHRAKNNLAVIIGLLTLQSQHAQDRPIAEVFEDIRTRIRTMAEAHEMIYNSKDLAHLDVPAYVENLVDRLLLSLGQQGTKITVEKEIEEVTFGLDTAVPLGFLITELVSNCLKHAFPEREEGKVRITLKFTNDLVFEIVVTDNGVGISEEFDEEKHKSMGWTLINAYVEQLRGEVEFTRADGTEIRVRFKDLGNRRWS